jgi:hypothetical protein
MPCRMFHPHLWSEFLYPPKGLTCNAVISFMKDNCEAGRNHQFSEEAARHQIHQATRNHPLVFPWHRTHSVSLKTAKASMTNSLFLTDQTWKWVQWELHPMAHGVSSESTSNPNDYIDTI